MIYKYHLTRNSQIPLRILLPKQLNIEPSISTDPKKFWPFIQVKKCTYRIPGLMVYDIDDIELSTPLDIVNAFGNYFNSTFICSTPFDSSRLSLMSNTTSKITTSQIFTVDVLDRLKRSYYRICWYSFFYTKRLCTDSGPTSVYFV